MNTLCFLIPGVQSKTETPQQYMARIKREEKNKVQYGTGDSAKANAMPAMSWDTLETEANAVPQKKTMSTGRRGRNGNGTNSTFTNNGEFDGSEPAPPSSNNNVLAQMEGGTINPNRSKPRALFVGKTGAPVMTWNDIEQINMNDLNNALGTFNPGQRLSGSKKKGKKSNFYGMKKGGGKTGRNAATTSLLKYNSSGGGGDDANDDMMSPSGGGRRGGSNASPLQARRSLKESSAGGTSKNSPKPPAGGRSKVAAASGRDDNKKNKSQEMQQQGGRGGGRSTSNQLPPTGRKVKFAKR